MKAVHALRGSWLRATVIAVGALEAQIWIVLIAHDAPHFGAPWDARMVVVYYATTVGPSLVCAILALVFGIANKWLWFALALVIVGPLHFLYVVPLLFKPIDM